MNKKNIFPWLLIGLLILCMPACSFNFKLGSDINVEPDSSLRRTLLGSGNVVSEDRTVSGFSKVDMGGRGNLVIVLGDEDTLLVEAEENLIGYIDTKVQGNTLVIRNKSDVNIEPTKEIHYYLTVKSLEALSVSGKGDVSVPSLETDHFSVDISSFGGLSIENLDTKLFSVNMSSFGDLSIETLNTEQLNVDISGMGDLVINGGRVGKQEVNISSLGSYEAGELVSGEAEVHLSNMGSVTVRVADYLRAEISGKGTVRYFGNPIVDAKLIGSGKVEQAGN